MQNNKTRLPLYVQAKNYILDLMGSGDYPPGAKLPTENELMAVLGVGRATVRAALAELEFENKLEKRHGIGSFVSAAKETYSFEPLVSLTYSLKQMGTEIENIILFCDYESPKSGLLEGWPNQKAIGHLRRLRKAHGKPVAVEDSYFLPDIFEMIKNLPPQDSVARALLSYPGMHIERIDMSVVVRKPDKNEKEFLQIKGDEKVAQMTRWIYQRDNPTPVNCVRFVLPEVLMGLSQWSGSQI